MSQFTCTDTEVFNPDGTLHMRILTPKPELMREYADQFNARLNGEGRPIDWGSMPTGELPKKLAKQLK